MQRNEAQVRFELIDPALEDAPQRALAERLAEHAQPRLRGQQKVDVARFPELAVSHDELRAAAEETLRLFEELDIHQCQNL